MAKLTPAQKLDKQQRDNLQSLCNRLTSAFQFERAKTWADIYRIEGIDDAAIPKLYPDKYNQPVTFPDLREHYNELRKNLEAVIEKRNTPLPPEAPPAPSDVVTEVLDDVEKHTADDDYGLHSSDKESAYLFWFQKKVVKEMYDAIVRDGFTGLACLASTGTGKTFMMGALIRRLVDIKFADNKTFGSTKYLYVTRATIVEQTKRVFEKFFGLSMRDSVEILNIEQLRSRAGQIWVEEQVIIEGGVERIIWKWRKMLNPVVIIWDECQALKNEKSTQHQIAAALNDVTPPVVQLFVSATPFTRVCEAKCFAVSTHKTIAGNLSFISGHTATLSNASWPTYASSIAAPSGADEYNEAAVDRLVRDLDPYIKRVRGVRPQFDAINSIRMIHFRNREERLFYEAAWERYLEEKAKLEKQKNDGDGSASGFMILVQFLKFRMAAELCRAPFLAEEMFKATREGYAAVAALNFKGAIIKCVQTLESLGVSRDKISLVWGGGQTQLTKKQKAKQDIKAKAAGLAAAGLSMDEIMKSLDLDEVEDRELEDLPEHLRLGPQSKEDRQREIDRFQSGKTQYCLYTFRAGGVGLSLHHSDEQTKDWNRTLSEFDSWYAEFADLSDTVKRNGVIIDNPKKPKPGKCRRKDSGYVEEKDVKFIPVRPRKNFVAPTYSAIELVQGLGRCPRLTSLSNTPQELLFYAGTIEDDVARIVAQKLRCLTRVVRMRESWQDVVVGGVKVDEHITNTEGQVDNPDDLSGGSEEEEE